MGTAKRRSGRQRASALIVTLGVLTVLALLAFTFSGLSRGERNISRVYVDHVRARILAMSGVEKARSMALAALAIPPSSQLYYSIAEGADPLNGYGAGAPAPAGGQVYSYPSVPVEYARYPSYRVDLTGKPGTVNGFLHIPELDNEFDYRVPPLSPGSKQHLFGASGVLPATYIKNGVPGWDYYAIKIIDGNGRIYVNGEDPVGYAGTPTPLKNNHLRLLNNLGTVMNQSGKLSGSNVNLGTIITNARASKNITTLSEIKPYMNGTQQQKDADFQALSSVLTTYAWVDPSVVNASKIVHPRADDPNIQYDSGPSIAYGPEAGGREPLLAMGTSGFEPFDILTGMGGIGRSVEPSSRVRSGPVLLPSCGSDRLVSDDAGDYAAHWSTNTSSGETTLSGVNPNIGPIQQARAPVNINSASLDVLTAVFLNVRGLYMVKSPNQYHTHTGSGWTAPATPLNTNYAVGIDLNTAQKIAKQIMTWRMNLARLPGDPTITPPNAPDSLSVPYPPGRRFGFACWEDFNTFVDNALSMALYGQTAAQIRQLYASSPATYAQRLAMLSLVKGHANPNSTLNKFNPDRTLGSAYADLDKGDIKQWTTELCFQSGGYFEIESVGRVLAPAEWVG
ncbi:MAG: hypothetical protein HYY93_12730, partial [Planctomycetes bacterium]|nr:hypothetical protein [Planctomycetota bacterium]